MEGPGTRRPKAEKVEATVDPLGTEKVEATVDPLGFYRASACFWATAAQVEEEVTCGTLPPPLHRWTAELYAKEQQEILPPS